MTCRFLFSFLEAFGQLWFRIMKLEHSGRRSKRPGFSWILLFWVLLAACQIPVGKFVSSPLVPDTTAPTKILPSTPSPLASPKEGQKIVTFVPTELPFPYLTAGVVPIATLANIQLGAGHGVGGVWFDLYFTDPTSGLASQETGGLDGPLAEAINKARLSVDMAIYSLSLNGIRAALLHAHDRGVRVRMVMESDNLYQSDPQILMHAGIPIIGDYQPGIMHNKYVVIDNSEVWTGSMNYTESGAYADNNNLIHIHSTEVAEDYTKEFEEMFIEDRFGENVLAETPNPRVTLDGTPIEIYFSPDDGVATRLLDLIMGAKESIDFMMFSFTSDPLGQAVRERAEQGVTVRGVMDLDQVAIDIGSEYTAFRDAGLDVRLDGNEGQMHHKVMIIDKQTVVTGSYNFTNSAETRNDENVLVINSKDIAKQYLAEFQRVFEQAHQ
jgi:phosphatidylserine/phosphatidylglycerophosphate/cardiolipin synthase-like enzyme